MLFPGVLRITHRAVEGGEVLAVEGRLVGPWVEELRRVALEARARAGRVELDLTRVRFAELEGAALVRRLEAEGCAVRGLSGFLEELGRRSAP